MGIINSRADFFIGSPGDGVPVSLGDSIDVRRLKGVLADLDGGVTGVTGEVTGDARVAGGETGVTGDARAGGSSLDIVIGIIRSTDTPLLR